MLAKTIVTPLDVTYSCTAVLCDQHMNDYGCSLLDLILSLSQEKITDSHFWIFLGI